MERSTSMDSTSVSGTSVAGTVCLDGEQVRVESVSCTNPLVVHSARRYLEATSAGELVTWLDRELELAARVEALAAPVLDVATHKASIDELSGLYRKGTKWFEAQLAKQVEAAVGAGGALPQAIDAGLERLQQSLEQLTSAESSPLRAAMSEVLERSRTELTKMVDMTTSSQVADLQKLLAPSNAASPLHTFLEMQRQANQHLEQTMGALNQSVMTIAQALAVHKVHNATPLKGGPHEADLGSVLGALAVVMGADYEATGRRSGANGTASWVGDHVVAWVHEQTTTRAPRVVIEAKNTVLSTNAWRKEARAALCNREAQAYIGVVVDETQVPGKQRVALVEDNVVIIAYDPRRDDHGLLVAALRLMCAQAQAVLRSSVGDGDPHALAEALAQARGHLGRFAEAAKRLSSIRHAADGLDQLLGEIRSTLEETLARACGALQAPAPGSVEGPEPRALQPQSAPCAIEAAHDTLEADF